MIITFTMKQANDNTKCVAVGYFFILNDTYRDIE